MVAIQKKIFAGKGGLMGTRNMASDTNPEEEIEKKYRKLKLRKENLFCKERNEQKRNLQCVKVIYTHEKMRQHPGQKGRVILGHNCSRLHKEGWCTLS